MKKILIVNVNWLGDVLFTTPIFKALKQAYPDSFLACMAVPRVKEMLEGNPYIDELIIFDEDAGHKSLWGKIKFIAELKKKKFDLAFLLHRSFTRAFLVYLAGIPERIGYNTKKRGFLLTRAVDPLDYNAVHRMDYYLNLVESYGIKVEDRKYEFFIRQEDKDFAANLLEENKVGRSDFLVALNPGGNWDLKRWPKERFAFLGDKLSQEFNAKVVITGAAKDTFLAMEIETLMNHKPVILTGKTSLKQLAALFEMAKLVVSADSGPMHIACAMGTPTVAIFGPTSPEVTGPRGKSPAAVVRRETDCKIPCYELICRDNRCMKIVRAEDVLAEIKKLMTNDKIQSTK